MCRHDEYRAASLFGFLLRRHHTDGFQTMLSYQSTSKVYLGDESLDSGENLDGHVCVGGELNNKSAIKKTFICIPCPQK